MNLLRNVYHNNPRRFYALLVVLILLIVLVILSTDSLRRGVQQFWNDYSGFTSYTYLEAGYHQRSKTLWDLLDLAIIPFAVAVGLFWLNTRADTREKQRAEQRERENQAREEDRFREDALQKYYDDMATLIIEKDLKGEMRKATTEDGEIPHTVRDIAQLRTLTIMRRLKKNRLNELFNFLRDSGLASGEHGILLKGANLAGIELEDVRLQSLNLENTNLREANLSGADLQDANLLGADLRRVNLSGADLKGANLSGADLTVANLSEAKFFNADLSGAEFFSANLSGAKLRRVDLSGANFEVANLSEANLLNANLLGANLLGTNLSGADLNGVNLSGVTLKEANLLGADLQDANLTEANLQNANLLGVNLQNANLSGAGLEDAAFDNQSILPDSQATELNEPSYLAWTPDTDMSRYTSADHPHFWQPTWAATGFESHKAWREAGKPRRDKNNETE